MSGKTISENFSGNARGRPGKYTPQGKVLLSQLYPEYSWRHVQNCMYMARPFKLLRGNTHEKYKWLVGDEDGRGAKKTILSELGRLYDITHDEEDLLAIAGWLCDEKPKTHDAIWMLRAVRRDFKQAVME